MAQKQKNHLNSLFLFAFVSLEHVHSLLVSVMTGVLFFHNFIPASEFRFADFRVL